MEKAEINKLLVCILEILEMMVESGAEIYRVEESAARVCKAYGMERVDIYATTSNITVIESRNSVNPHYFDTKSLIWSQIFDENLSMPIAMNIGKIKFAKI